MKKIKKLKFLNVISLIMLLVFFTMPMVTNAATTPSIFLDIPQTVHVGDTFSVLVNADTGGELINSVKFDLNYDHSLLSFAGYKDDDTLIKFWISAPAESNGKISMSGIIPGGVSGLYDPNRPGVSPIPLVHIIFIAKAAGDAKLFFTDSQILKHDGKGTELVHEDKPGDVKISESVNPNNSSSVSPSDAISPEPFTITLLESSVFGQTPDMITFQTDDLGSGIRGYQMRIDGGDWQDVQSPQPITRSLFSRDVTIRAFDFNGNFEESNVTIPGLIPANLTWIIFIVLALSGILIFKLLKYKHEIPPQS